MKTYFKFKILVGLCVSFMLTGCDLDLQENFNFKPEVDLTDPHSNKTAWEFIQENTVFNEDGSYDNEELNYMEAAIRKAGFVDLYNQTETTDRTYLLLNNGAFRGSGDVIQIITGSSSSSITEIIDGEEVTREATPDEIMARVDTPEKMEKLRKVLRYHIVTDYIAQVPTLFESEVWYLFQTLIPGDDGLIAFKRDSRWRMQINRNPAPLPATALSQWENVRRHNYVFNNGIGHFINDPVRNQPY